MYSMCIVNWTYINRYILLDILEVNIPESNFDWIILFFAAICHIAHSFIVDKKKSTLLKLFI